ncbi:MAG: NYN domain-containing protein [Nocardioides sp.]|nr:NYN domain-containing protein [Nocardioides sp.]
MHLQEFGEPGRPGQSRELRLSRGKTRSYVLVDLENVTFGGRVSRTQLRALWHEFASVALEDSAEAHIVVGTSRRTAQRYAGALPARDVKWVIGPDAPDGADHALLSAIDLRRVARRYDELVIASGDHIFSDLARAARHHGLSVRAITTRDPREPHRNRMSAALRTAAHLATSLAVPSGAAQPATPTHKVARPRPQAA